MDDGLKPWKNEREIQLFLINTPGALEQLLGVKIKSVHSEIVPPFNIDTGKGSTVKQRSTGRVDILVVDDNNWLHIIEVKHPSKKKGLLVNAKGVAQLLFYEAVLARHGHRVESMVLATSDLDVPTQEIIPRNKLRVQVAKITRDAIYLVKSYQHKYDSTTWKPKRKGSRKGKA